MQRDALKILTSHSTNLGGGGGTTQTSVCIYTLQRISFSNRSMAWFFCHFDLKGKISLSNLVRFNRNIAMSRHLAGKETTFTGRPEAQPRSKFEL